MCIEIIFKAVFFVVFHLTRYSKRLTPLIPVRIGQEQSLMKSSLSVETVHSLPSLPPPSHPTSHSTRPRSSAQPPYWSFHTSTGLQDTSQLNKCNILSYMDLSGYIMSWSRANFFVFSKNESHLLFLFSHLEHCILIYNIVATVINFVCIKI